MKGIQATSPSSSNVLQLSGLEPLISDYELDKDIHPELIQARKLIQNYTPLGSLGLGPAVTTNDNALIIFITCYSSNASMT